jgi:hypothetical protein
MKTKLIAVSTLAATLAAFPVLAGPPGGVTMNGAGVAAAPWVKQAPREMRPYALLGGKPAAQPPLTRDTVQVGPGRATFDTYRR